MTRAALSLAAALAAASAAPAPAQEGGAPLPPQAAADTIPDETSVGVLHAAGYSVSEIATTPATDAAVVRFSFIMEHPDGAARPLFMCRLLVGPGEEELEEPLVIINRCERMK